MTRQQMRCCTGSKKTSRVEDQSGQHRELQAENGCAGSQVLRELSAAKLYFLAQRQFWRPLRGLLLFRSMPIKDNPLFALIATHGDHLASALIQARTQIEKTPKWEDHFKALYIRAQQQGYVGLEHFVEAGFPTFEDPCLLVYPSYQEPPRDIQLEDGSLHPELASERLYMDGDSPAGSWLYTFWLRRCGGRHHAGGLDGPRWLPRL